MALVLDTGVVYAALDSDDPDHQRCAQLLEETREQLIIPAAVLVEVDYWVRKAASAEVWLSFVQDIQAGAYSIYPMDPYPLGAAAELQVRFADQAIGLVDAAVFCNCEVLGEDKVATLDRRHFSVLRTTDGRSLRIVPE